MARDDRYFSIRQQFYQARTVDEIKQQLQQAGVLRDGQLAANDEAAYDLIADAFLTLLSLTRDDVETSTDLMVGLLLPLLEDESAPPGTEYPISRCRDRLIEWLERLPTHEREPRRKLLLDHLLTQVQQCPEEPVSHRHQSVCWTIERIGLRRDDVPPALWRVVHRHDDEQGDIALSVLAALGPLPPDRSAILEEAHHRAEQRRSRPLIRTLNLLADPTSIDMVLRWLEARESPEDPFGDALCFGVLAQIADREDGLAEEQRSQAMQAPLIWQKLKQQVTQDIERFGWQMYLRGDLASVCPSEEVVPTLLQLASQEVGEKDEAFHRRYLFYNRAAECLRPPHLAGWTTIDLSQEQTLLERLQTDACRDTQNKGRFATSVKLLKELAWQTVLRLGYANGLEWFEAGVAQETNTFLQAELCELLAAFRYEEVPDSALAWVRQPLELNEDASGRALAHLGAIKLACSAASTKAFEALQQCGLLINGDWIEDTATSLGAVAVQLAREGHATIHTSLFEQLQGSRHHGTQTGAAFALQKLAASHLLPVEESSLVSQILPLLTDASRSTYQHSLLIMILGEQLKSLPPAVEECLLDLARTDQEWAGWIALYTLELFGRLSQQEELLTQRLNLQAIGTQWDLRQGEKPSVRVPSLERQQQNWFCSVLGLLYQHEPERFAPAMITCLEDSSITLIHGLLNGLETLHMRNGQGRLPERIEEALMRRLHAWNTMLFPSLDLLSDVARLAPRSFVQQPWQELTNDWATQVRAALADALGEALVSSEEVRNAAIGQLVLLTRDGQYAVRRAAYRVLGKQVSSILLMVCEVWAASPFVDLRRRAAEACSWLAEADQADAQRLYALLRHDPELSVREDALRAWRERRERSWAAEALGRMLQVTEWNNDAVFQLWRYGEALSQLGDDDVFQTLQGHLQKQQLPNHVRFWFLRIIEAGEKHWEEVMKKWPEPWELWKPTHTQPDAESSSQLTMGLEVVPEDSPDADQALTDAIGRDTTDVLRQDGYTVEPVYSGQRGGFLVEVALPFLNTLWTNKDIILADSSELVAIFTSVVLITRHLHAAHKRRIERYRVLQSQIRVYTEIDGVSFAVEASDLESVEAALQLASRFQKQHPATAAKVSKQSTVKVTARVTAGQSRKRR